MAFPSSLDAPNSPGAATLENAAGYEHDVVHTAHNTSIVAIEKAVPSVVNVRTFRAAGAVGDGSTDDAAAFQAAVTQVQNAGGGVVYVPPSSNGYLLKSTITISSNNVRIVGAGERCTIIFIGHNGDGFLIQNSNDSGIEHVMIETAGVAGTYAPTSLVHIKATQSNNCNRCYLDHMRVVGRSKNALRGVWVEFSGTTDGGIYDCSFHHVNVTDCTTGWDIECSAVAAFTQRNVQHNFVGGVVDSCTTGLRVRYCGLLYFFSWDNAGHTTAFDLDGARVLTWFGSYAAGSTTEWSIANVASGSTNYLMWIGGDIDGEADFIAAGGEIWNLGQINAHIYKGTCGTLGRNSLGVATTQRLLPWGAAAGGWTYRDSTTSSNASTVSIGALTPDTTGITSGAAACYRVTYEIAGQSTTQGNCASYLLTATFKATNTAGTITVSQIGSTTVLSSHEADAAWDATLSVGGTTTIRASVQGKSGDGAITWECLVSIVEAIQA